MLMAFLMILIASILFGAFKEMLSLMNIDSEMRMLVSAIPMILFNYQIIVGLGAVVPNASILINTIAQIVLMMVAVVVYLMTDRVMSKFGIGTEN
jgi:DNA integrity scanning protein DisA with diadenylate cyclase activity